MVVCLRRMPHCDRQRGQVLQTVREAAEMDQNVIKLNTGLIIKRGPEFLVGRILGTRELKWSLSPWDAWRTRDREEAEAVARAIAGDLWLFNPILGQIREYRGEGKKE